MLCKCRGLEVYTLGLSLYPIEHVEPLVEHEVDLTDPAKKHFIHSIICVQFTFTLEISNDVFVQGLITAQHRYCCYWSFPVT